MKSGKKIWPEVFLSIIIIFFILSKIPALNLPYFWDELGVYARAGLYMADNGVGFLPNALPPELSRGHPLLFTFFYGVAFSMFEDSVITGHITSLFISVILLVSVYIITKNIYSYPTALVAVMLVIVQPVFYAQSVLVLPEICLAIFILWSIFFWVRGKYFLYALFSSLAILIKETAIVIPAVIFFSELLILIFNYKRAGRMKIKAMHLLLFAPFFVFGLFLIIQKVQNGWYLFPYHKDNIQFSFIRVKMFTADFCSFVFYEQGRIIMSLISIMILFFWTIKKQFIFNRFSVFLVMLIIGGILFSALNFYMNRYMIFVIIPCIILFSSIVIQYKTYSPSVLLLIPVVMICCIYTMNGKYLIGRENSSLNFEERFDYDENMLYVEYLETQNRAIDFVVNIAGPGDRIYANFPASYGLMDPRHGFTKAVIGNDFQNATLNNFKYAIISEPGSYDHMLQPSDSLQVINTFQNEVIKIIVYKSN